MRPLCVLIPQLFRRVLLYIVFASYGFENPQYCDGEKDSHQKEPLLLDYWKFQSIEECS